MKIERKDIIEKYLYSEGFSIRPGTLGLLISQRKERRKNPMEGKSRNLVTIGGEVKRSDIIDMGGPDEGGPHYMEVIGAERKPVDMKLGSILTKEQETTERADWDSHGRECRETSDKFDEENGIC